MALQSYEKRDVPRGASDDEETHHQGFITAEVRLRA